jgi:hypothetical protein
LLPGTALKFLQYPAADAKAFMAYSDNEKTDAVFHGGFRAEVFSS